MILYYCVRISIWQKTQPIQAVSSKSTARGYTWCTLVTDILNVYVGTNNPEKEFDTNSNAKKHSQQLHRMKLLTFLNDYVGIRQKTFYTTSHVKKHSCCYTPCSRWLFLNNLRRNQLFEMCSLQLHMIIIYRPGQWGYCYGRTITVNPHVVSSVHYYERKGEAEPTHIG